MWVNSDPSVHFKARSTSFKFAILVIKYCKKLKYFLPKENITV